MLVMVSGVRRKSVYEYVGELGEWGLSVRGGGSKGVIIYLCVRSARVDLLPFDTSRRDGNVLRSRHSPPSEAENDW